LTDLQIIEATAGPHLSLARELFLEYAAGVGSAICFQEFEGEVAGLPADYAPPAGRLLLALSGDEAVGCVALRPFNHGRAEMKRLFLRPGARGKGAGKQLVVTLIDLAREIGYRSILLDTLPDRMASAIHLYKSLGFREIDSYKSKPVEGTLYMELPLSG